MAARSTPTWRRPSVILLALVIVAAVAAVATIELTRGPATPPRAVAAGSGAATLTQKLSDIDGGVSAAVGSGGVAVQLTPLTGAAALRDPSGKPIVLFVSSEPCVGCASQRWALVVALSRFGTFSHLPLLPLTGGSAAASYATFSFSGAAYTSRYLSFIGVEQTDTDGHALQALSTQGQQLLGTYDAPPFVPAPAKGFIPWLDIANRYAIQGSAFPPPVIADLDWAHITARFPTASDAVTRAIIGSANQLTAAICAVTNMQPASACRAAPIPSLVAVLH